MRVEVDYRQILERPPERFHDRISDGMIAAQANRALPFFKDRRDGMLDRGKWITVGASRISGGAAAEPRLYDEFASKGTPRSVGAPQGNFPFAGLDMDTPQASITLHLLEEFMRRVQFLRITGY